MAAFAMDGSQCLIRGAQYRSILIENHRNWNVGQDGTQAPFVCKRTAERTPLQLAEDFQDYAASKIDTTIGKNAQGQIASLRTERLNPPIEHLDANRAAPFQCILRDFARGGAVGLFESRVTHRRVQELMKLSEAAPRKNFLAGNSWHALLEELQQADL